MRVFKSLVVVGVMLAAFSGTVAQASTIDIKEYPTGYFTASQSSTYDAPYYRWFNEDWGWTHGGVDAPTTSATLFISAWDVDASQGEVDNIYAYLGNTKTLLGSLKGLNDNWGYTTFNLDINIWGAELVSGLRVWMDIDSTHNSNTWAVALAKAVVTIDGGTPPPPNPGGVPDGGATLALLGGALMGLGVLRRKFRA